jgi:ABC-type sugar transport system substrate-binding protein
VKSFARVAAALTVLAAIAAAAGGVATSGHAGQAETAQSALRLPKGANPAAKQCRGAASVGFTIPLPDPNYELISGIIRRDVRAAGGRYRSAVANLQPNKQIADVDSMIQAGVKVLIVAPVNPQAIQPALNRARRRGVKLVVTDVFIGGPYATNVATSPYDAGFGAARFLRDRVGSGKVAAILAPNFAGPVIAARNAGFEAGAQQLGLNVVEREVIAQFTPEEGRRIAEQYKLKHGDLRAIWTFNDLMALGAQGAISGSFQPQIVGVNGEPPVIDLIRAGRVAATFNLHPEAIAHTLAWAAEAARCGKRMPRTIWVPVTRVDRANVSAWVPWERLPQQRFRVTVAKRGAKYWVQLP